MGSQTNIVTHPYAATLIRIKAKQLCRRTDFTRCEVEDLQQSMWAYLVEKAPLYNPNRRNIEAFITMLVNTWVAMELRHRGREKRQPARRNASMERTMVLHEGDALPLGKTLSESDRLRRLGLELGSDSEDFEKREAIAHAVSQLTFEQQKLLADVAETNVVAAADKHGVSPSTVRRRLNAMRKIFNNAGFGPDAR